MIVSRLRTLMAKIEEEKGVRVTYEELAEASGLTRQTIAKMAKNQSQRTRLTLEQFDKIIKALNSHGYDFTIGDLLNSIEDPDNNRS